MLSGFPVVVLIWILGAVGESPHPKPQGKVLEHKIFRHIVSPMRCFEMPRVNITGCYGSGLQANPLSASHSGRGESQWQKRSE